MTASPSSRGLRGYAGSILAGLISAGLFSFANSPEEAVLSFFASLSSIPLFVVGLSVGIPGVAIAAATTVAGLCAVKSSMTAVWFMVAYGLPAVGLIVLALRRHTVNGRSEWCAEGDLLTAMTIYPCLVFVMLAAATSGQEGGLLALTTQKLLADMEELKKAVAIDAETYTNLIAFTRIVARVLPAIVGGFWIFIIMFSGGVAQTTVKQQKWNLRPNFSLTNISIPNWLIFAAAASGLMAAFAPAPFNYIGLNLAIILFMAFFLAGISLVHAYAATSRARIGILLVYYGLMIFPWTSIFLSTLTLLLGLVDQWADFRRRFINPKRGG